MSREELSPVGDILITSEGEFERFEGDLTLSGEFSTEKIQAALWERFGKDVRIVSWGDLGKSPDGVTKYHYIVLKKKS